MLYGLKNTIIEQINSIFSKYSKIEKVVLYGSRAKGNYKNGSDIDLVLYGNNLSSFFVNKLINEIDDLLLPYTFDISIFENISNQDLIEHINRIGVVFFKTGNQKSL